MRKSLNLAIGLSVSCLALASASAQAQDAAPSAEEANSLDIIVTAQRRAENLKDVPASIVAVTVETLTKAGVTNTADIARVVPGVGMTFQGGWLQPAIRGVTSVGSNIGDNSNVAMYIDGVYQPQQIASLIDLPDIERIEVLKGPQGALYGQNATGGAILISSFKPQFDLGGRLSASYGNYNNIQLRGYVTGPLSDKIAASVSGGYQNRNGFRRHVVTGTRNLDLKTKVIRGKLLFEPSDGASITVSGYYSDRGDSATFAGIPLDNYSIGYAMFPNAPKATSPKQFAADPNTYFRTKSFGGNIRGEFDTGAGTFTAMTALFRNKTRYRGSDPDFSPVDFTEAGPSDLQARYFVQEVNFVSDKFGPFSFLAGGFYLNGSEEWKHNRFQIRSPTIPPAPRGAVLFGLDGKARLDKEILAFYGEATFDVTEQFVITAGGRYTSERQRGFAGNGQPEPLSGPLVERPGGAVTFSQFTPRITAKYAITPDINVYASWGKGFKSGLVQTANSASLLQDPVKPEVITAYEVGLKGRLHETLSFNLAAYYYDYKDMQFTAYNPPNAYIQQNAASARIKGVDFDATWNATPGLSLTAGIAWLPSAKYVKFPNAATFVKLDPCNLVTSSCYAQITEDLSGARMLRTPEITLNLSANYELETSAGKFGAFASLYHSDDYGFEVSGRFRQKAYTTVDGELSFSPSGMEGLRFVLWSKNLFDKVYLAQSLQSGFAVGTSYADPQTFGGRVEFNF